MVLHTMWKAVCMFARPESDDCGQVHVGIAGEVHIDIADHSFFVGVLVMTVLLHLQLLFVHRGTCLCSGTRLLGCWEQPTWCCWS